MLEGSHKNCFCFICLIVNKSQTRSQSIIATKLYQAKLVHAVLVLFNRVDLILVPFNLGFFFCFRTKNSKTNYSSEVDRIVARISLKIKQMKKPKPCITL